MSLHFGPCAFLLRGKRAVIHRCLENPSQLSVVAAAAAAAAVVVEVESERSLCEQDRPTLVR